MGRNDGVSIDFEVDFEDDFMDDHSKAIASGMEDAADWLTNKLKRIAPVDTGTFMRSIDWVKLTDNRVIVGSSDVPGKVFALEKGHSDQAPNGVFEVTVNSNKREIQRVFIQGYKKSSWVE